MRTITKERAMDIAANWYHGQRSTLYAFASTGTITKKCLDEIKGCKPVLKYDRKELERLERYVIAEMTKEFLAFVKSDDDFKIAYKKIETNKTFKDVCSDVASYVVNNLPEFTIDGAVMYQSYKEFFGELIDLDEVYVVFVDYCN